MGITASRFENNTELNEHLLSNTQNYQSPIEPYGHIDQTENNRNQKWYYSPDYGSNTMLILATKYGYKDIVYRLLKDGTFDTHPNERTASGKTALTYALEYAKYDIVYEDIAELLLAAGGTE